MTKLNGKSFLAACFWLFAAPLSTQASPDSAASVLMFHNDKSRTGWYRYEKHLTPANVSASTFGKIWTHPFDGDVSAAPLCVVGLTIGGKTRDVLYVAANDNTVTALDAVDGSVLWGPKHLAPPLNNAQFMGTAYTGERYGITSTPVIDLPNRTIYVTTLVQPGIRQQYKVWALDIMTGAVRKGWPSTVRGSYRGCEFNAGQVLQRSAMLLNGHRLYFAFGSRQDIPDWHGWVAEVDVDHPQAPPALFTPDPNADGGGIWGIGGVAVDGEGTVYAVTGNGEYDLYKGGHDVGQCALKLHLVNGKLIFSEKPSDYYIPRNYAYLNSTDQDLGGSGEVLLPDLKGSSTPHLLLTAGKDGLVYLINRDNFGKLVQKTRLYGDPKDEFIAEIRATPAYFQDAYGNGFVIVTGNDLGPVWDGVDGPHTMISVRPGCAGVTSLRVTSTPGGPARLVREWTLPAPLTQPSAPEVSSDGYKNAIVWVTERFHDARGGGLDAFDASTGRKLYSTEDNRKRDGYGSPLSFSCPTVVDGRVYVGTGEGVVAYGLLPASTEGK